MRQRTHAPPYRVHFCRCRAHNVGRSMLCWTLVDLDTMILQGYQLSTDCEVLVEMSSTVLLFIGCTCCSLGQGCYISVLSRRMPFRYLSTCVFPWAICTCVYMCVHVCTCVLYHISFFFRSSQRRTRHEAVYSVCRCNYRTLLHNPSLVILFLVIALLVPLSLSPEVRWE